MKSREYKAFLKQVSTLTPSQRVTLLHVIDEGKNKKSQAVKEIESRLEGESHCPCCGSRNIGKWGEDKGLRRYRCRECKRTFNALTGTPLARLRMKDRWAKFSACLLESRTVQESADVCGVHRDTSFRWRHRFLAGMNNNKAQALKGVVEADETFFLESKKGSRNLLRSPRKRGGKALKRGRSSEQICVLVARDRSGQITDHLLPKFNADALDASLGPVIDSDALLCTDGLKVYRTFSKRKGILHKTVTVSKGEHVRAKTIHLQNVNAYHSRLKGWMIRFHGVSTRWLSNYLGWRRMLDCREKLLTPLLVLKASISSIGFNA